MRRPPARWLLALVGFLGHAPGLWLLLGVKLDRLAWRSNIAALAATIGAMAIAAWRSERPAFSALIAWFVGHLVWSAWLSILAFFAHVSCERAGSDGPAPPQ